MESFYKKNEIGVSIEYTVVGYYKDEGIKYVIYTDFVEDKESPTAIRLFVSKYENGQMVDVDKEKRDKIIGEMFQQIAEKAGI
jgi:hypothetical protein